MEHGFFTLVQWLNGRGRRPRPRCRPGHRSASLRLDALCNGGALRRCIGASPRYFRRQGRSLALAPVLGAVDLHYENVIAAGEYPIIVDLETLFHAAAPPPGPARAGRAAAQAMNESVIQTLLLPVHVEGDPDPDGAPRRSDRARSASPGKTMRSSWPRSGKARTPTRCAWLWCAPPCPPPPVCRSSTASGSRPQAMWTTSWRASATPMIRLATCPATRSSPPTDRWLVFAALRRGAFAPTLCAPARA